MCFCNRNSMLFMFLTQKRYAIAGTMLYFSADNPTLADEPLYETVKSIFLAGFSGVIIDEVHFARDWSLHLKALFDDFPAHSLWASDSSALVLRSGIGDLSRRFVPIRMPLLSFREFLFLKTGTLHPATDPFIETKLPVQPTPEILAAFREYRSTGTLAGAAIPRLQVRSLCADWGIGAEKLYQILNVMESVGILRIIRIENDTKAKTAGEKLFFSDPAFYPVLRGNAGTAREALVAALCAESGWLVEAARNEAEGDFVISRNVGGVTTKLTLEVGGASKKIKSADFVIRDDIDFPGRNAIPLWLLGMMR